MAIPYAVSYTDGLDTKFDIYSPSPIPATGFELKVFTAADQREYLLWPSLKNFALMSGTDKEITIPKIKTAMDQVLFFINQPIAKMPIPRATKDARVYVRYKVII